MKQKTPYVKFFHDTSMVADKMSRENKLVIEILNSTVKFIGEQYNVGLLWNGNQSALSKNFASALGQHRGLTA